MMLLTLCSKNAKLLKNNKKKNHTILMHQFKNILKTIVHDAAECFPNDQPLYFIKKDQMPLRIVNYEK